jgi:hypothetical protein
MRALYVAMFLAAGVSVGLSATLPVNSATLVALYAAWMLAPYLTLTTVMVIAERRTSLMATAVATLLGAVGALPPVVMMALFDENALAGFLPIYQAAAIALLLPTAKWLLARIDVTPPKPPA